MIRIETFQSELIMSHIKFFRDALFFMNRNMVWYSRKLILNGLKRAPPQINIFQFGILFQNHKKSSKSISIIIW